MKIFYLISTLIISALTSFVVGVNYLPEENLGSTITTINSTDLIKDSRAVINTNLANLNTDKLERSDYFGTTTAPQLTTLANLATVGTITTGVWNGTAITVAKGGTGSTTLLSNAVLLGKGTNAIGSVGSYGVAGQLLTSSGAGNPPTWSSPSVDTSINYIWTGFHTFGSAGFTTATATTMSITTLSSAGGGWGKLELSQHATSSVALANTDTEYSVYSGCSTVGVENDDTLTIDTSFYTLGGAGAAYYKFIIGNGTASSTIASSSAGSIGDKQFWEVTVRNKTAAPKQTVYGSRYSNTTYNQINTTSSIDLSSGYCLNFLVRYTGGTADVGTLDWLDVIHYK